MSTPPVEATDTDGLLAWGERVRRDLPWRHTRDPWAVLVSEVMLQQTQAARVVPKWEEFLDRWPTPAAAAGAPLAELLAVWSGLGYPRRCKALHDTARVVTERHGGALPADLRSLMDLPGIGPYTARAVLAFAFEHDVGVVDTNIARVLARRSGGSLTTRQAQQLADDLVAPGTGWAHNQSLMDLGALLCRPTPACDDCPLAATCAWALEGWPEPDPAVGSAGVSTRQGPFEGSDRQARGRVLRAVADRPLALADLAPLLGWTGDASRALRVAHSLVDDGLLRETDDGFASVG